MLSTPSVEVLTDIDLPPVSPHRKPILLVVDDEEGPRQSLRVVFKDDFKVLLASDGPSAIDLAQRHLDQQESIDVAVIDIRMARMSGIEVLGQLKYVDASIEAVMMTAFETTETIRQALRLQACDYINKPFDVSTMRAAVNRALKRRSLAGELVRNSEKLQQLETELHQQRIEEERVKTRGDIFASIIHDINGPLTVISGLIQIINQRMGDEPCLEGEDLESVKDRLKRITRQVTNCIEISRRYLSFLRQNPGENSRVWVNQVLGDLGDLLRVHPSARNNQLVIQPLPEDLAVVMNGVDLIQVLLNLTLNAMQCSANAHRIEISGQKLTHPLDLQQFADGPEDRFINGEVFHNVAPLLALSVQDNGPGIGPDVLPRIFDAYFTTQPFTRGTGLGLCIVQRLLKEARAGLHVHSRPGQGTIFTLYLPALPANSETAASPPTFAPE